MTTHTPAYIWHTKIQLYLTPHHDSAYGLLLVSYLTLDISLSALFTSYPSQTSFPLIFFSVKEVDNTLTVIIVSVLGGVIGLVIIVMVIKALVVHFLLKDDEKK